MNKKVPVGEVDKALTDIRSKFEQDALDAEFIEEVRKSILREDEETERQKRPRKELLVVKRADDVDGNSTGWVVALNQGVNPATIFDRLNSIKNDFNVSKKGRKKPVNTIGEIFAYVPQKYFKEQQIEKRTKDAIYLLTEE